jgi:hypothetical protein
MASLEPFRVNNGPRSSMMGPIDLSLVKMDPSKVSSRSSDHVIFSIRDRVGIEKCDSWVPANPSRHACMASLEPFNVNNGPRSSMRGPMDLSLVQMGPSKVSSRSSDHVIFSIRDRVGIEHPQGHFSASFSN